MWEFFLQCSSPLPIFAGAIRPYDYCPPQPSPTLSEGFDAVRVVPPLAFSASLETQARVTRVTGSRASHFCQTNTAPHTHHIRTRQTIRTSRQPQHILVRYTVQPGLQSKTQASNLDESRASVAHRVLPVRFEARYLSLIGLLDSETTQYFNIRLCPRIV